MVDTCHVTGVLVAPDGQPLAGIVALFERHPRQVYPASPDSVAPQIVRATADGSGAISVNLVPAQYKVSTQPGNYPPFMIVVPDEPAANLADIQDAMPEPYLTQAQQIVEQVSTARDEAVEARDDAFNLYADLSAVQDAKNAAVAAAASAEALYGDLSAIDQAVTDAEGAAAAAAASLQAAQEITGGAYGIGTRPMELPRNTELASGAFAPYEAHSLYPILPTGSRTLTPDDNGKIVWSVGHNVTLPDSTAPGMQPGWRAWVKNTHGSSSLTIDCADSDTLDGGANITLAAGESRLLVLIATGQFGSL